MKERDMEAQVFCLAYVGQRRVPTTEEEKDELFEAGEKEIELDLSAEEFKRDVI